jgi:hypothetical protein
MASIAQTPQSARYYHFISEIPVKTTIDILIKDSKVQGWVFMNGLKGPIQSIEVEGNYNSFTKVLNLYSSKDDKVLIFNGLIKEKGRLEGLLAGRGEAASTKIALDEDYPLGSVGLTPILYNESRSLFNMKNSPIASISIQYPELGNEVSPQIKTKMANRFKSIYTDSTLEFSTAKGFIQHIASVYFNDYFEMNREAYNPEFSAATFSWEKIFSFSVGRNNGNVLSLGFTTYAFTGGAHGMQVNTVQNFDLVTGKAIELADMVDTSNYKELETILTNALKKELNLQLQDSLSNHGFFVNSISPLANVWMLNEGLVFVYNPYEIAPYSFGSTKVSVPYTEIKHLLRDNAVVKKVCNCLD